MCINCINYRLLGSVYSALSFSKNEHAHTDNSIRQSEILMFGLLDSWKVWGLRNNILHSWIVQGLRKIISIFQFRIVG